MNLNILSIATMIAIAKFWLTDVAARAIFGGHELARAYRGQLLLAYDLLRVLQMRRSDAKRELRALTKELTALDKRHDDKARAVYYHLLALRMGTDDPKMAAECDELLAVFFPQGLRFVSWSYVEEGGWAESMNEQMTPTLRARLSTIQVGEYTLAELFDSWLEAGMMLAQKTLLRSRLETTISAGGASDAAVSVREARTHWITTVQTFLRSLDLMRFTAEQRESLLTPLEKSIALAEYRRANGDDSDELPPELVTDIEPEPGTEPEPEPEPVTEPEPGTEPELTDELTAAGRARPSIDNVVS